MKFNIAYYIAERGPILDICKKYSADRAAWHKSVFEFLRGIGGVAFQTNLDGEVYSVKFENDAPKGFKAQNKQGCREPYAKSEWPAKLAALGTRPCAGDYLDPFIKAPRRIQYKTRTGGVGSILTGHPFAFYQILWFSEDGPFCVALPDIERDIKRIKEDSVEITSDISLNLPKGLRRILVEEWDLMVAKARLSQEAA